jgi:Phage integrase family
VRGDAPGPLFVPVDKAGKMTMRRMIGSAVLYMLRRRAEDAGVARFSPHDLRRSFVGDLLDAGADISTVQRLAWHAQVTTTQRYDRRGEREKRRAAELLHVPYPRASGLIDSPCRRRPARMADVGEGDHAIIASSRRQRPSERRGRDLYTDGASALPFAAITDRSRQRAERFRRRRGNPMASDALITMGFIASGGL